MIEGLKVTVSGAELMNHCGERAAYHTARAAKYMDQVRQLGELQDGSGGTSASNDPRVGMKDKATHHEERAGYFLFLNKHINAEETYLLTEGELGHVEIVGARRW